MKGRFITFEGPEGSGKSTHSKLLSEYLREKGYAVVYTREPGGTSIGERIRDILLDPHNEEMDGICEMFLYMASRAQLVGEVISPALKEGKVVICDRFWDATIAYQGYGQGIDIEVIKDMSRIITDLTPDITILLDLPPEEGLKKVGRDRLESKPLCYHQRVREGYLHLAHRYPQRIKVVSVAKRSIEETQSRIREVIQQCLLRI